MNFDIISNPEKYGYKVCSHCNGYGSSLKDPIEITVCTLCGGSGVIKNNLKDTGGKDDK